MELNTTSDPYSARQICSQRDELLNTKNTFQPKSFTTCTAVHSLSSLQHCQWTCKQSLYRPLGFQEDPRVSTQLAHEGGMVVSPTYQLPPPDIPGSHYHQSLSWSQGHTAARRNKSMKSSNYPIKNQTRDLPAFSAMPQPLALLHTSTDM
jgi:hypothetical protein